MGRVQCSPELSQGPPIPREQEGFLCPQDWGAATHQVPHGHTAAIAEVLDDLGSGVPPAGAELDLCAWSWPLSMGPQGLATGCLPPLEL